MRKYMTIVDQEDHICPFLTVRESLDFAAKFYIHESEERQHKVDKVIKKLGLETCQHTRCGNQFFKVITALMAVPKLIIGIQTRNQNKSAWLHLCIS